MPETVSLDGVRQELMESYGEEEDRERLLALLNIVRDLLAHSRVPLEDLLREGPSEVFEAAENLKPAFFRKSPRQLAFDFRTEFKTKEIRNPDGGRERGIFHFISVPAQCRGKPYRSKTSAN